MKRNRSRTLSISLFAILVTTSPVAAFLVPGIERPSTPEPTEAPTPSVAAERLVAPSAAAEAPAAAAAPRSVAPLKWVNGWAFTASYLYSKQDLHVKGGGQSLDGKSSVDTYSGRIEHIVTPWLSVYGLIGHHYGDSEVSGFPKASLDGWLAGAGIDLSIAPVQGKLVRQFSIGGTSIAYRPFAQLGFNYTYNDFDDVKNGIDIFSLTGRFGMLTRTDKYTLDFYAGPAFQDATEKQIVKGPMGPVRLHVVPEDRWNGAIGMVLGLLPDPNALVPPVSVIVEGGVGNRNTILASLRLVWL